MPRSTTGLEGELKSACGDHTPELTITQPRYTTAEVHTTPDYIIDGYIDVNLHLLYTILKRHGLRGDAVWIPVLSDSDVPAGEQAVPGAARRQTYKLLIECFSLDRKQKGTTRTLSAHLGHAGLVPFEDGIEDHDHRAVYHDLYLTLRKRCLESPGLEVHYVQSPGSTRVTYHLPRLPLDIVEGWKDTLKITVASRLTSNFVILYLKTRTVKSRKRGAPL